MGPSSPGFRRWRLVALYLGLALMLVALHAHAVDFGPKAHKRAHRHELIMSGQGRAPWAYRVLSPALAQATSVAIAPVVGEERALAASYIIWRAVWTLALLLLFHRLIRTWLDPPGALAGTLLLAALHPVTFQFYWFQPDSPVDMVVWTAAALLTVRGKGWWILPVVIAGALNRETALFAVVVHLVLGWDRESRRALLSRGAVLAGSWGAVFLGVRLVVGARPWSGDVGALALANVTHPSWLAWAAVFLGALWVLPWLSWRRQPLDLRRLSVILVVTYLPLQLVFGRIREVRLLLPLALVLIPMAVLALRDGDVD